MKKQNLALRYAKARNWIIAGCGLWEFGDIAALFVPGFGHVQAFVWSHILTGLVLMLAGAIAARTDNPTTARNLNRIVSGAGLWLIIAPFILGRPAVAAGLWNDIIVGAIVVILVVWTALAARQETR